MNSDRAQIMALGNAEGSYSWLVERVNHFIRAAWPGTDVDPQIRAYRALEEMLELCQVLGITSEKCEELVKYVYGRPVGELTQEMGGVAFTTTALFSSLGHNFIHEGFAAVDEAYGRIDKIREKSKTKPHVV